MTITLAVVQSSAASGIKYKTSSYSYISQCHTSFHICNYITVIVQLLQIHFLQFSIDLFALLV